MTPRHRLLTPLGATGLLAALALGAGPAVAAAPPITPVELSADGAALGLSVLGTYASGVVGESAAEIVVHHAPTQRLFVVNAQSGVVDVLDARRLARGGGDATKIGVLDPTGVRAADGSTVPEGSTVNSVAVRRDGIVALAVEAPEKTDAGWVVLFDTAPRFPRTDQTAPLRAEPVRALRVGSLPDALAFTPDGIRLVVANEGEPADDFSSDPVGSVAVIRVGITKWQAGRLAQSEVRTAGFEAYDTGARQLPAGVRVFGPTPEADLPISRNLEPELPTVSADGRTAWVTLQEAGAIAVVDVRTATVTNVLPLGTADHSRAGAGIDASDRDGGVHISPWPVSGLRLPDGITDYRVKGRTYLVTANEGDAREWGDYEEPARVKDLAAAGQLAPGLLTAAQLRDDALGRLEVSTAAPHDAQGRITALQSFGTRSFSIFDTSGKLVFDSGDALERITAEAFPLGFNASNDDATADARSDAKGPEPEYVAVGEVGGRTYAFVGLERVGGVAVFDITRPAESAFVTYLNNRDFGGDVEAGTAGDLGPEGVTFLPAAESPTGRAAVAVANEVSGTTTLLGVDRLR